MVFSPVLWVQYIIWYGLRVGCGILFVIVEPLLAWVGYGLGVVELGRLHVVIYF